MTLTIGIDPRIRARRIAVRRAEGRRRLRFLLVVAGLVLLAVAGWAISRSPLLDLDRVHIDGVAGPRAVAIEQALGLDRGTPLIDLDLGGIEADVESLPWVESVDARREWPGTLTVEVHERVPVASVDGAAGPLLVDASGVVIGPDLGITGVPAIAVTATVEPGGTETAALQALAVVASMPLDLTPWVERITIGPEGAGGEPGLGLDLVGSARVEMGGAEHLADKLAAVRAVLGSADLGCMVRIDVSVPDLTTVSRDPVCDGRTTSTGPSSADG